MPEDRDAPLRAALAKMDDDLGWRGPGGRTQAYVLLPRDLAEATATALRELLAARDGRA